MLRPRGDYERVHFIVFSDASKDTYACTTYLLYEYAHGPPKIGLLAAKSKVKPAASTTLTIPRLELLAIEIGSRIAESAIAAMGTETPSTIRFFSDSMVALYWILRFEQMKCWVNNRVTGMCMTAQADEKYRSFVPYRRSNSLSKVISMTHSTLRCLTKMFKNHVWEGDIMKKFTASQGPLSLPTVALQRRAVARHLVMLEHYKEAESLGLEFPAKFDPKRDSQPTTTYEIVVGCSEIVGSFSNRIEEQRTKSVAFSQGKLKIDSSEFDTCDAQLLQEARKWNFCGMYEMSSPYYNPTPHTSRNQWNRIGIVARNIELFHEFHMGVFGQASTTSFKPIVVEDLTEEFVEARLKKCQKELEFLAQMMRAKAQESADLQSLLQHFDEFGTSTAVSIPKWNHNDQLELGISQLLKKKLKAIWRTKNETDNRRDSFVQRGAMNKILDEQIYPTFSGRMISCLYKMEVSVYRMKYLMVAPVVFEGEMQGFDTAPRYISQWKLLEEMAGLGFD
ncbi:unnamed protein product [Caenorhabditis brenneri]